MVPIASKGHIYSKVYDDLEGLLTNPEDIEKIHQQYAGTTVTFPRKLYSQEYIEHYIASHYSAEPAGKIARHLGMTERRVRQIMQEMKSVQKTK